jgi:hypothetical protein
MTGIRFRFYRLVPEYGDEKGETARSSSPNFRTKRGKELKELKELVRRLVTERNNVR